MNFGAAFELATTFATEIGATRVLIPAIRALSARILDGNRLGATAFAEIQIKRQKDDERHENARTPAENRKRRQTAPFGVGGDETRNGRGDNNSE